MQKRRNCNIVLLVSLKGGLAEEVDDKVLHAAFIPFGELVDINIPLDYETGNKLSLTVPLASDILGKRASFQIVSNALLYSRKASGICVCGV